MRTPRMLTLRQAVCLLVVAWAVGAGLFVASWRSTVTSDRQRQARECAATEAFTAAACRLVLDGTVSSLSHELVEFRIGDRTVPMRIRLVGDLSGVVGGPARVTFYAGQPVAAAGPHLRVDASGSPADNAYNYRQMGIAILLTGTVIMGGIALVRILLRAAHITVT